jgi:2-polyprenyl-3-methyl-5-hydroxy-6-metoxy-1,4-benzoquinol methylase
MQEKKRDKTEESFQAKNIADFLEIWLTSNFLSSDNQETLNNYYRSYKKTFGEYIKKNYCRQTQEVIDVLSEFNDPTILEVGSGCGTESLWLALRGANVTGIDIDDNLLSVAKSRKEIIEEHTKQKLACNFFNNSVLDLNPESKFDIIWMEQTFHHLEPRKQVLDKISTLVKKNGYIIISEANAWNPLNQLFFFKVRGFKTIIKNMGHEWGNERITTPHAINKELTKRGIKKISNSYFRTLPNFPIANKLSFLDNLIPQFITPLFTHYNYVGKKL